MRWFSNRLLQAPTQEKPATWAKQSQLSEKHIPSCTLQVLVRVPPASIACTAVAPRKFSSHWIVRSLLANPICEAQFGNVTEFSLWPLSGPASFHWGAQGTPFLYANNIVPSILNIFLKNKGMLKPLFFMKMLRTDGTLWFAPQ